MASDPAITTPEAAEAMAATGRSARAAGRFAEWLSGSVNALLGAGMIASVLLNCANVLARYVFGFALVGADELMIYGMVATIFLGGISVTWKEAHLRLDVLVETMPPAVRGAARRCSDLVLALLCGTVGYASAEMALEMAHFDQRSLAAELPMVVPHGAVAIGLILMAVMALLRFFLPITAPAPGPEVRP
jgi:TRAP-type C4-dicarboxylate transport system permease small subunit